MEKAPVRAMLNHYRKMCRLRMHMPGHKGCPADDVTELSLTDNLHEPTGAIQIAQERLAEAVGAYRSFFLVNGSTAGLQAMLLYARTGAILTQRDCHRGVYTACALARTTVHFLEYHTDDTYLPLPVSPTGVAKELDRHPEIGAVLITSPNYYGMCCDIAGIAAVVHERGKLLLVDEAHGAHFPYSKLLPPSAGETGADLWVQSAHKTLPALTQGAYLHCARGIDGERLARVLSALQTTSPSFLLMRSLDDARAQLQAHGEREYRRLCREVERFTVRLKGSGIERVCIGDMSRLVLDVRGQGMSGTQADWLLQQQGIFVEMSDVYRLVCILSIRDGRRELNQLLRGLLKLPRGVQPFHADLPQLPAEYLPVSPEIALAAPAEVVPPEQAICRICAQTVGAYPPGSALLAMGEGINASAVEYIKQLHALGVAITGMTQNGIYVLKE